MNRMHSFQRNRDPKLPKVHFRSAPNTALCDGKAIILEDRIEKVNCKNCLKKHGKTK